MHIEIIIYISSSIFITLGIVVAIWSFIDTYRIRSAEDYHQSQENKKEAAKRRYKEKTKLGK